MSEFKTGVVVELKSGGPPMTCANTPCPETGQVQCLWFVGDKLQRGEFQQEGLVIHMGKLQEYTELEESEARRLAILMSTGQCEHTAPAEPAAEQQASDSNAATPDPEHP
jgi:uncharacterized protein YodC (DUF2158 family)